MSAVDKKCIHKDIYIEGISYIAYLDLELIVTIWGHGQYAGYKKKGPVVLGGEFNGKS